MQNILVATDFSENSNRTLRYALELSAKNNFNIFLFHDPKVTLSSRTPANLLTELLEGYQAEFAQKMREQVKEISAKIGLKTPGGINYIVALEQGTTFQKINAAVSKYKIDLIFTGTRGNGGIKRFFLGSTSLELMQSADCPVFAVPEKGEYVKIEEIVLATELNDIDEHVLKVINFAKFFEAELFILHITDADASQINTEAVADDFKKRTGYNKISLRIARSANTAEKEILEYLHREKIIDLLVMFPHRRGFTDRIFGVGHTGNIISEIDIPLLAFPSGEMQS